MKGKEGGEEGSNVSTVNIYMCMDYLALSKIPLHLLTLSA